MVTYLAAARQVKRSPQTPAKVRPPAASPSLPAGEPAAEPADRVSPTPPPLKEGTHAEEGFGRASAARPGGAAQRRVPPRRKAVATVRPHLDSSPHLTLLDSLGAKLGATPPQPPGRENSLGPRESRRSRTKRSAMEWSLRRVEIGERWGRKEVRKVGSKGAEAIIIIPL